MSQAHCDNAGLRAPDVFGPLPAPVGNRPPAFELADVVAADRLEVRVPTSGEGAGTTSADLSGPSFSNFLRTAPSDDVQAKLMAILMKGLSATSSLIACPDFFIFRH